MKKMIRSSLSKEEEQVFIFSLNDKIRLAKLEWEDDHEFRLDEKMYDVIEQKTENGKLIIRCISDEKETALVKEYEAMNKNEMSGNSPGSKTITLINLFSYYLPAENSLSFTSEMNVFQASFLLPDNISKGHKKIFTPPPQVS